MTRRPADIPPEVWAKTLRGQSERLERAWLRLFCALIPEREARHRLRWMAGWGPIGMLMAGVVGLGGRVLTQAVTRGYLPR